MFVDLMLLAGTEFVIVAGSAVTLLVLAGLQHRRRVRQQPLRRAAESALAGWLAADQSRLEPVREALAPLPPGERSLLVMGLAGNLEGESLSAVQRLAEVLNLTRLAERSLRSGRWWVRLRGARYFSTLRLLPLDLGRLLRDSHPQVRAEAVTLACSSGDPGLVEQAARELFGPPSLSRFAAQLNLVKARGLASAALGKLLSEPPGDPCLALQVARSVSEPSMMDAALRFTALTESVSVRVAAVELLGQLGGEGAPGRLLELLEDESPQVQSAAVLALGQVNHWAAGPRLAERLSASEWGVRRAAATALKRLGPPGELFLRKLATEGEEPARSMARWALQAPEFA